MWGYKYVLTTLPLFSGWVASCPKAAALTARNGLVLCFSLREIPPTLSSDKGIQFTGAVLRDTLSLCHLGCAALTICSPQRKWNEQIVT